MVQRKKKGTSQATASTSKTTRAKTERVASAKPTGTSANSAPQASPITVELHHDQVAQRAYAIWVAKGRPDGQDTQNWQEAEQQLTVELHRRK